MIVNLTVTYTHTIDDSAWCIAWPFLGSTPSHVSSRPKLLWALRYMPLYDQFPARMRERIGNLHIHQVKLIEAS
jgi:hypothetical protein